MERDRERPGAIKPFPDTGSYEMARGERDNLVMILQIMLDVLKLYYDDFGATAPCGVFDGATEEAVKVFQTLGGLPATGRVDVETWNRLAEEYNAAVCIDP